MKNNIGLLSILAASMSIPIIPASRVRVGNRFEIYDPSGYLLDFSTPHTSTCPEIDAKLAVAREREVKRRIELAAQKRARKAAKKSI